MATRHGKSYGILFSIFLLHTPLHPTEGGSVTATTEDRWTFCFLDALGNIQGKQRGEEAVWWLNLGKPWPNAHPATLSLPLVSKTWRGNRMRKLMGRDKDREIV